LISENYEHEIRNISNTPQENASGAVIPAALNPPSETPSRRQRRVMKKNAGHVGAKRAQTLGDTYPFFKIYSDNRKNCKFCL
jgi:hypothetical protein